MANKLYLIATECHSGKSLVALGLAKALMEMGRKVAFFRPIISDPEKPGAKDPYLDLLLGHFKHDMNYADAYAFTLSEARALTNAGKGGVIIDTILAKCKKLEQQYDFLLCLGSDFTGRDGYFEFCLNAEAAANLAAPAFSVINARGRTAKDSIESALLSFEVMRSNVMNIMGCVINRATVIPAESKEISDALTARDIDGVTPLVYVVPQAVEEATGPDHAIALCERYIDTKALAGAVLDRKVTTITPKMFEFALMEKAKSNKMRIVLPEGLEERILRAAAVVGEHGVADLILLGDEAGIKQKIADLKLSVNARIIDPGRDANFESYAQAYAEARKAKGISIEDARKTMLDPSYYGTMMVQRNDADGMVSGSINTTAHTIKPAFEFVKTKPGVSIVSSIFLMCLRDRVLAFGDCAVNPNPTPEQLASIAISSAHTARVFGVEPKVAMLSYSTGTSGKGPDVDAVVEAVRIAREKDPNLIIEGPLQYDAAIDPTVAKIKLPGNPVAGQATVFIFPDLNTGNVTYKSVQRAANAVAVGPVLQGLNKPVNDLSRGCTVPDIINTIAITAVQAQAEKGLL